MRKRPSCHDFRDQCPKLLRMVMTCDNSYILRHPKGQSAITVPRPGVHPYLLALIFSFSMSFQGLISGSECAAPANPLSQVLKHTEADRSLQQVRLSPF